MSTPAQMIEMQEQSRRLRSIRDALLPKLFSGELNIAHVSPDGAVWIQLHGDIADGPPPGTEEEGSVPESLDI